MTNEEIKQYEDKIRSIALNGKFIERIVLHDARYYNAFEHPYFINFNKVHSKGDPKYSDSWFPFYRGKRIGTYDTNIYETEIFWTTKYCTTDEIINEIVNRLINRQGEGHVSKTEKEGILYIDPYIEVVIRNKKYQDTIILSYDDYRTAHEKYIEITDKFKEVNILYDK